MLTSDGLFKQVFVFESLYLIVQTSIHPDLQRTTRGITVLMTPAGIV